MGTSSIELDHASSPKVAEHETRTSGDLKESSPTAANELDSGTSSKNLETSSSSLSRTNGNLIEISPTAANELDPVTSSKNLVTSSSSLSHSPLPDSPIEHPHSTTTPSQTEVEGNDKLDSNFGTGHSKDEHETPTAETPASTSDAGTSDDEVQLFSLDSGDDKENNRTSDDKVALSTLSPELNDSTFELGSNDPTTSPPAQVMERPSGSKYRIPSSVFARSKSNNPDWSMASNESLFSIQMGNMSFINDDLWKSGEIALKSAELEMIKNGDLDMLRSREPENKSEELEMPSEDLGIKNEELGTGSKEPETIPEEAATPTETPMSSQMFSYSLAPDIATSNSGKTAELGVAIETMKEVLREAADQKSKNSSPDEPVVRTSNARPSTESSAFSSVAGNSLRVGSTNKSGIGSSRKPQPQSPTQSTSQPKNEQEPENPEAAPQTAKTGWFSWMSSNSCRPFCCL